MSPAHFRFLICDFGFQDPAVAIPARGDSGLKSKIKNRKSKIVRPLIALFLLALLAPALLATGCTIFPEGVYWRPMEALHEPGAAPVRAEPRPLLPVPAAEAEAAARRAALQENLTRRWSGEDLARSARAMDGAAGRAVYADVMQTVVWFYVDPITYGRLVAAGVESLRAALDNPEFRRRFPEADQADRRERFAQGLDILDLKVRAADPVLAWQAADWLAVAMEKNRAILGLPDGAVVAEFLFGAFDSLDPWSRYLTPEMDRTYREQVEGAYVGIGAEMTRRDRRFFIHEVFEGGGAAGAGLKAGDEVLAVDGRPVEDLSLPELGRLLRGKAGTPVTVSVRSAALVVFLDAMSDFYFWGATGGLPASADRAPHGRTSRPWHPVDSGAIFSETMPGTARDVVLERRRIHVPAVRDARMLDAGRGIAYVRLAEFQEGAEGQLRGAVEDLSRQGAKALILDLRDNPGGERKENRRPPCSTGAAAGVRGPEQSSPQPRQLRPSPHSRRGFPS